MQRSSNWEASWLDGLSICVMKLLRIMTGVREKAVCKAYMREMGQ